MITMKAIEYQIEAITNLHVGSGEANFGVVDRLVQKDAATGFPNINASGIKGALRELFDSQGQQSQMIDEQKGKNWTKMIFGSEPNDPNSREAGLFRFFDAYLLGMPVRSDKTPFLMGSCPRLIQDYIRFSDLFGCSLDESLTTTIKGLLKQVLNKKDDERPLVFTDEYEGAFIEDFEKGAKYFQVNDELIAAKDWLATLLGGPVAMFSDQAFMRLCDEDHLPVMARNNLTENQRNLWFEQVLPRFSRLYFFVMMPTESSKSNEKINMDDLEVFFNNRLNQAGVVQLGANATVGYGYCTFTKKLI